MHITGLCTYLVCNYAELLPIEIAYIQMGPTSSYAVKRVMQLSGMHLSGVHCTLSVCRTMQSSNVLDENFVQSENFCFPPNYFFIFTSFMIFGVIYKW